MTELHLDRLTLRLGGVSEADGRRLAQLVCAALASASPPQGAGSTDAMAIAIAGRSGESLELLAHRIVGELLRATARALS